MDSAPTLEDDWIRSEEQFFFEEWIELGFLPIEALALIREGLSPSLVREFVKHNPECDVRLAVRILL